MNHNGIALARNRPLQSGMRARVIEMPTCRRDQYLSLLLIAREQPERANGGFIKVLTAGEFSEMRVENAGAIAFDEPIEKPRRQHLRNSVTGIACVETGRMRLAAK